MPFNEILAILMLVAFFVLLLAGIPVAVTLAAFCAWLFGYIGFGSAPVQPAPQSASTA